MELHDDTHLFQTLLYEFLYTRHRPLNYSFFGRHTQLEFPGLLLYLGTMNSYKDCNWIGSYFRPPFLNDVSHPDIFVDVDREVRTSTDQWLINVTHNQSIDTSNSLYGF